MLGETLDEYLDTTNDVSVAPTETSADSNKGVMELSPSEVEQLGTATAALGINMVDDDILEHDPEHCEECLKA